ncbi:MAG TPA: hypothetical protein VNT60_00305 [Deinococcales bacterium]|nr:hypothetical protein [Deinococcales bacterium]
MNALVATTLRLLGDALPEKVLRASLNEGLLAAGGSEEAATRAQVEQALKASVYRQLQVTMPAQLAKARVQQALNALAAQDPEPAPPQPPAPERGLGALEDGLRRFNLYFEWPEVQHLRGLVQALRDGRARGEAADDLVRQVQDGLAGLDEKLRRLLAAQAADIAQLRNSLEEVRGRGGPKVRRLEALVVQIAEAQRGGTLAPAEVERARGLAAALKAGDDSLSASALPVLREPAPRPDPPAQAVPQPRAETPQPEPSAEVPQPEPKAAMPQPEGEDLTFDFSNLDEPAPAGGSEEEAAASIAAALHDARRIDSLLDVLGGDSQPHSRSELRPVGGPPPSARASQAGRPVVEAPPEALSALHPSLRSWLESLSLEPAVAGVALVSADGSLLAGRLEDPPEAVRRLGAWFAASEAAGRAFRLGRSRISSLEFAQGAAVVVRLASNAAVIVLLDDAALLPRVLNQAREDAPRLAASVRATIF